MGPRVVAEKEAANGIGANAQAGLRAFDNDLGRRARDGRQQPIETTFASYEFQFPAVVHGDQFVVPFGNAQDSVDRLGPCRGNFFFSDHGVENFAQGITEVGRAGKQGLRSIGIRAGECQKRGASLVGNDVRGLEENDQFFPREVACGCA